MDGLSFLTYRNVKSLGYTPIEYIENTSTSDSTAIDTGYKFDLSCDDFEIQFGQDEIYNGMPCGTYSGTYFWLYSYTSAGYIRFVYNVDGLRSYNLCPQDTDTHIFKFIGRTSSFTTIFDGKESTRNADWDGTETTTDNVFVFGRPNNPYKGKIHYFKLWKNGVLTLVWIPVRRDSDGVLGFFDLQSNTFFTASGNSGYVAGADIPINNPSRNIEFPIYNENGESFHDIKLRKATYDSVVMSLGDKITGDFYYKDNTLEFSMKEYVVYKDTKFVLVNPPTVVREGMVADNSDAKGLTKYSIEFYHPMCELSNIPFTDIAVTSDELKYKSQDKTFSWAGYLADFIAKLNKNLQNTKWIVRLSENVSQDKLSKFSDVLTFDKNTIADVLKTAYETWEEPFIIDNIGFEDDDYIYGKRFLILFGLPSNEIYIDENARTLNSPYIFKFGQGVGLKNNSATPKNNKIVTRLAGCGSTTNIPYGYPQIPWTGNSSWDYTVNNNPNAANSYPIYKGIYGGQYVKLIKHPFTRESLMPNVYVETLNRKVNPLATGYDPDTEIVDYYDALDDGTFQNPINPIAPSYEYHAFEDIKPELGVENILDAWPINNDGTDAEDWVDDIDEDGNYLQSYFKIRLPLLDFDLYACAAITEEMKINMRSGACIGCTFQVQVDWDDYKANFYDTNGDFAPNGAQRDLTKYPKSNATSIVLILQKEFDTFGTIMPNIYQKTKGADGTYNGDEFVILGISLPISYVTNAQNRLDSAMNEYMLENNVYYFDYPLKFDEYFLANHLYLLEQIRNNTIVRFLFGEMNVVLYVKQITIKYGESPLPQFSITLTDDVEIVLNQIGQVTEDVSRMRVDISALQYYYSKNFEKELNSKLSKVNDDTAAGVINFSQGLTAGAWLADSSGASIYPNENGNWVIEGDFFHVRKKLTAETIEIMHSSHIGGKLIATAGAIVISSIEIGSGAAYYKCYFNTTDSDGNTIYNTFVVGDLAYCETFNLSQNESSTTHTDATIANNRFYWRKVIAVGTNYISLSNASGEYAAESDAPVVGDNVTLLGNVSNTERQNAIIMASVGSGNPYIRLYKGINTFSLPTPDVQISPNGSWITVKDSQGTDVRIDTLISSLEDEIELVKNQEDKQIVLWFGDTTPTLNNAPASDWTTTDLKNEHLKDIYYHRDAGLAYSFELNNNVYSWELLTDADVLESLERANAAQDTADNKRRVFVAQPTPPYDVGDMWVNAVYPTSGSIIVDGTTYTPSNPLYNNDVLRCSTAKSESGSFSINDWTPAQYYTRNNLESKITQTASDINLTITNLETNLETAGIHIDGANSKITLTAETTEVSDTLSVSRLETRPDTSTNANNLAKVEIHGSEMNVFGTLGARNIQFGVDENGYAVLKYFDNNGNMLYDLGPTGLKYINTNGETLVPTNIVWIDNDPTASGDHSNETSGAIVNLVDVYAYTANRYNGQITGGPKTHNNDSIAFQANGLWFDDNDNIYTQDQVGNDILNESMLVTGLGRVKTNNNIITLSNLNDWSGNVDEAKRWLMDIGVSQSNVDELDFEISHTSLNYKLVQPIYRQTYWEFNNGVRTDRVEAWQNQPH